MATVKRLLSDIDNKIAEEKPAPKTEPKPVAKPTAINPANVLKEAKTGKENPKLDHIKEYFSIWGNPGPREFDEVVKFYKLGDEDASELRKHFGYDKPKPAEKAVKAPEKANLSDFEKQQKDFFNGKGNPPGWTDPDDLPGGKNNPLSGNSKGKPDDDFSKTKSQMADYIAKAEKAYGKLDGRVSKGTLGIIDGLKRSLIKDFGMSEEEAVKAVDAYWYSPGWVKEAVKSDTYAQDKLKEWLGNSGNKTETADPEKTRAELARREAEAAAPKEPGLRGAWKDEIVTNKNKQSFLDENGFDKDFYWVGNDLVSKKTGESVYSLPNGGDQTSFILNRMRYGSEGNKRSAEPAKIDPRQVYQNASNAKPRTNSEIIDQSSRDISAELDAQLKNGQISKEEWQEKKANLEAFNRSRKVRAELEKRTGRKYSDEEWATIVELASQLR